MEYTKLSRCSSRQNNNGLAIDFSNGLLQCALKWLYLSKKGTYLT
jgi:hypothetical protein